MTVATGSDGKDYEMFSVALDSLPMWLATIEPNRLKPEARFKLAAYQKECARVLRPLTPRSAPMRGSLRAPP